MLGSLEAPRAKSVRGQGGGRDILARSVKVTERSRGGEGRIGANQLGGESRDGGKITRFDSTEESGD